LSVPFPRGHSFKSLGNKVARCRLECSDGRCRCPAPQPLTPSAVPPSSTPRRAVAGYWGHGGYTMVRAATISLWLVLLLVAPPLVLANPAVAQIAEVAPPNGQQGTIGATGATPSAAQGGQSGSGLGVICNELIAGTFCSSGPSAAGGYGSFSAGTAAGNPSLPPCASGMPANELCN
jgi:hypothetical protein